MAIVTRAELKKHIDAGLNGKEIAKLLGIARKTVRRYCKEYLLTIPRENARKKLPYSKEDLLALHKQGLSSYEVARKLGYPFSTVSGWYKRYGIIKYTRKNDAFETLLTPAHLTDKELKVIVGSLLGDGYLDIRKSKREPSVRFTLTHCTEQLPYLKAKFDSLSRLWTGNIIKREHTKVFPQGHTSDLVSYQTYTRSLRMLYPLWYIFYGQNGGVKCFPEQLIPVFDWEMLAYWVGDDGQAEHSGGRLSINLGYTSDKDKAAITKMLGKLGLVFTINPRKDKNQEDGLGIDLLRFDSASSLHIKENCQKYLPPVMWYKFRFIETRLKREDVFLEPSYLLNLSDQDKDIHVEKTLQYYRDSGFPYQIPLRERALQALDTLESKAASLSITSGVLGSDNTSSSIASSFFPHMWEVKCNNYPSPLEVFNDDKKLRKILRKGLDKSGIISDTSLRSVLRAFSSAQAVSNFRPVAALTIYEAYAGDGAVWDMCAGFGGRLLGALASKKVRSYIGTDPSPLTYQGLLAMVKTYEGEHDKKVTILDTCAEDYIPLESSLDLCFTSPPYYNTEKYAEDITQSYIRYPSPKLWREGFLKGMLFRCFYGLKSGGHLIININNVPSYSNLVEDFLALAENLNFKYITTLNLELASRNRGKQAKREPVFVFVKP